MFFECSIIQFLQQLITFSNFYNVYVFLSGSGYMLIIINVVMKPDAFIDHLDTPLVLLVLKPGGRSSFTVITRVCKLSIKTKPTLHTSNGGCVKTRLYVRPSCQPRPAGCWRSAMSVVSAPLWRLGGVFPTSSGSWEETCSRPSSPSFNHVTEGQTHTGRFQWQFYC